MKFIYNNEEVDLDNFVNKETIGELSELTTENKDSIISAINEINEKLTLLLN